MDRDARFFDLPRRTHGRDARVTSTAQVAVTYSRGPTASTGEGRAWRRYDAARLSRARKRLTDCPRLSNREYVTGVTSRASSRLRSCPPMMTFAMLARAPAPGP